MMKIAVVPKKTKSGISLNDFFRVIANWVTNLVHDNFPI